MHKFTFLDVDKLAGGSCHQLMAIFARRIRNTNGKSMFHPLSVKNDYCRFQSNSKPNHCYWE